MCLMRPCILTAEEVRCHAGTTKRDEAHHVAPTCWNGSKAPINRIANGSPASPKSPRSKGRATWLSFWTCRAVASSAGRRPTA